MEPSDQLLIELAAQERWRDLLGEVLAVLNRDGGHYQTKHGAGRAAIEGIRSHYQIFTTVDVLQARIDAATVLIRQAMGERHTGIVTDRTGGAWINRRRCGSDLGTSIATCENCAPFRAWLAGDKEEHSE